jgi:phage baseplate assembly protein W
MIPPPKVIDQTDLNGEDVSLRGGDLTVTTGGDWGTLQGADSARQSVEREAVASPGDMPRRPDWGMGLRDSLMRGAARDVRDRQAAAVRRRLAANPRIQKVDVVDVSQRGDLAPGAVTVTISATANGQRVAFTSVVAPKKGV